MKILYTLSYARGRSRLILSNGWRGGSRLRNNLVYTYNIAEISQNALMPHKLRMLKKARRLTRPTPARQDAPFRGQGRSERRGEEVRTALRVGRSPGAWILANGKTPPVIPRSERPDSTR